MHKTSKELMNLSWGYDPTLEGSILRFEVYYSLKTNIGNPQMDMRLTTVPKDKRSISVPAPSSTSDYVYWVKAVANDGSSSPNSNTQDVQVTAPVEVPVYIPAPSNFLIT